MAKNTDCLRSLVNQVILPVSRIENHPLGANILHEYLNSFENAANRDIIWSIPQYLRCAEDVYWKSYTEIGILNNNVYKLTNEDKYNGIPLVYAWMLTTVNNIDRAMYRSELFNWAYKNTSEFYKLFKCTYTTNDPQMKEDLFAVAMSTVFMLQEGNPYIEYFSDFMLNNIFALDKLNENYNCAIRYYARAIVERSYKLGIITHDVVEKSRPPYNTNRVIELNNEATSGTRMGGFKAISYDLPRYVLYDPIKSIFFLITEVVKMM